MKKKLVKRISVLPTDSTEFTKLVVNHSDKMSVIHTTASAVVVVKVAELVTRDKYDLEYPCRPHLVIEGITETLEVNKTDETDLLYNFEIIQLKRSPLDITAFYEFNTNQLAELVKKGLYEKDFKIPEDLRPGKTMVVSVPLILTVFDIEKNVPLVFAEIENSQDLALGLNLNCEYDIAASFAMQVDDPTFIPGQNVTKSHETSYNKIIRHEILKTKELAEINERETIAHVPDAVIKAPESLSENYEAYQKHLVKIQHQEETSRNHIQNTIKDNIRDEMLAHDGNVIDDAEREYIQEMLNTSSSIGTLNKFEQDLLDGLEDGELEPGELDEFEI